MRRELLHRVSAACAILGLLHSATDAAEIVCSGALVGAPPRSLFLSTGNSYIPFDQAPPARASQLSLVFVTPSSTYKSGVVIIKLRHLVESAQPLPNPRIGLHRDRYSSPCTEKRNDPPIAEFPGDTDPQHYIRFHRYGLPDSSIAPVHADIGNRPARRFYEFDGRCASTADWDIAPQFLFEDNPADRYPLGFTQVLAYRVSSTYEAANQAAFAVPLSYNSYQGLAVQVVPYTKQPNVPACIKFTTGRIPSHASRTDVMVIDADDARFPNPQPEPQLTATFNWQ